MNKPPRLLLHLIVLPRVSDWVNQPDKRCNENDRLELVYCPPACPDLNPQEHIWEQAREHRSHNHSYHPFQALIDDFDAYLNETPFQTDFMNTYAPSILCASF